MYKIEISNQRKLEEIQEEFAEIFPHLFIIFYPIESENPYLYSEKINGSETEYLNSFRVKKNSGFLYLEDELTIEQLKDKLLTHFGIKAEFFQKISPNNWSINPVSNDICLKEISFELE